MHSLGNLFQQLLTSLYAIGGSKPWVELHVGGKSLLHVMHEAVVAVDVIVHETVHSDSVLRGYQIATIDVGL